MAEKYKPKDGHDNLRLREKFTRSYSWANWKNKPLKFSVNIKSQFHSQTVIESIVTNGMGYEPISERENLKGREIETSEDLQDYFWEIKEKDRKEDLEVYRADAFNLTSLIKDYGERVGYKNSILLWNISELKRDLSNLHEEIQKDMNNYENQIKQKDREINLLKSKMKRRIKLKNLLGKVLR